jgi:hypothetical protein
MKRNVFLRLVIATLAIVGAVYMVACKKELVTPIINNNEPTSFDDPYYTEDARKIVGKIKRFKTQLEEKEYLTKGDCNVPVDSVIWNIEALFNASYSFPDRKYEETVKQELEFFVQTNGNDEVLLSNEANLYEEIIASVRQAYANDGIVADKSLMAVDVSAGEKVGNNVCVKVNVISGKIDADNMPKDPVWGPFGPGDCWYFGEYGGTCDDPSAFGDAAEVIEDSINYYFRGEVVPNSGYRCLNYNMVRIFLDGYEYVDEQGNCYAYFYGLNDETPYYLGYEMLNYYYNRELALILNIVPSDPAYQGLWPSDPAFLEVDIMGLIGNVGNQSCAYHRNAITYCCKTIIPEHVLGPVRDLLN